MKSSGSNNDTSASANTSPVVNKHEHPPTPTIEEQLDTILRELLDFSPSRFQRQMKDGTVKQLSGMDVFNEAKAKVSLLITKAEQTARYNEIAELNHWLAEKDLAKDCPSRLFLYIVERFSDLQPQPSYSPAPGTDGEV